MGKREYRSEMYRALFTAAILLTYVAVVALAMVAYKTAPQLDADGKVLVDPFANAKDLLTGVAAVATLALGYWFGAAGKDAAQETASQAQGALSVAVASTPGDGKLDMKDLQQRFPKAFGQKG
jgi:hypothetical protein